MHILLIHQAFAALDEPGGTRHHELARYLAGRGHRVTVIASRVSYLTGSTSPPSRSPAGTPLPPLLSEDGKGAGDRDEIRILRTYTYSALHKSFVHRVFAFFSFMAASFLRGLAVRDVDLVWGTSPPIFQGVTAWLLARLKRVPFLFEVRDLWPEFAVAVGVLRNPLLIRMSRWLERFLYRRADRVVVNSPGYVDHVRALGGRQVDLVPNGADPSMFAPSADGAAFRRRCLDGRESRQAFIVLYAGAHGMSNDLGVVLDSAGLLAKTNPNVRIVLLGDGKEKPALQEQAARLGLDNVAFLPPLPKSEMAGALAGADACLAILKPIEAYKTTYPNKVFDYMAAGRPVILAIDGVIRAAVEAAGCGIFAQPGDPAALAAAIRSLAADRKLARAMGLKGRRYLEEHFSREKLAEKLMGILKEMTAERNG
jgi:glycosyltransferase involved in cell wall biosynthesis